MGAWVLGAGAVPGALVGCAAGMAGGLTATAVLKCEGYLMDPE